MAKLTYQRRKSLPTKSFAGPARSYPIEDEAHARNALARVSQFGSPSLKARVRAKVHKKFPGIQQQQMKVEGGAVKHRLDRHARHK